MEQGDLPDVQVPEGYELKWLTPSDGPDGVDLPLLPMVALCGVVALVVSLGIAWLFGPPILGRAGRLAGKDVKHVSLVVAHPDDEAMFFWPTLLQLYEAGVRISVLCLSTGNADGLGTTRALEMRRSCSKVGVTEADLVILDLERLQDGFHSWDEDLVAEQVLTFLHDRPTARLLLTFDGQGVSGHPNHVSASLGARRAADRAAGKPGSALEVLMLESVGLPAKYVGPLGLVLADLPESTLDADGAVAMCTCTRPLECLRAMAVHWSQLVWYRVLSALFSRYAYVNTYTRHVLVGEGGDGGGEAAASRKRLSEASQPGGSEESAQELRRRR